MGYFQSVSSSLGLLSAVRSASDKAYELLPPFFRISNFQLLLNYIHMSHRALHKIFYSGGPQS